MNEIAVISDIHGNLDSFNRFLNKNEIKDLICLGDLVGYNSYSKEIVYFLKSINEKNIDTQKISRMNKERSKVKRMKNTIDIFLKTYVNAIKDIPIYFQDIELNKSNLDNLISGFIHDFYQIVAKHKDLLDKEIYSSAFFSKIENLVDDVGENFSNNIDNFYYFFLNSNLRYYAWVNTIYNEELINQVASKINQYNSFFTVKGNHDFYMVNGGEDTDFSLPACLMLKIIRNDLTEEALNYLSNLPMSKVISSGEKTIRLAHAGLEDTADSFYNLFPYIGYSDHEINPENIMKNMKQDVMIYGHTHRNHIWVKRDEDIVDIFNFDEKISFEKNMLINLGSIGEPRDYIGPTYMIIYPDEKFEIKLI